MSKTVQTAGEDGKFEEKEIEGSEKTNTASTSKPLFEQLRSNREKMEAEMEEAQKARIRSTLALNEEDAAHLDSLQEQRLQREREERQRKQEELAAFKAAREDLLERPVDHAKEKKGQVNNTSLKKPVAPLLVIKKRRRKEDDPGVTSLPTKYAKEETKQPPEIDGLLSGYGSSSDDEE